ncbi:putative manganese efflux pump MntP [Clostridium sp. CAG:245]|jgi:putative Mn2+ efflux pump MntP|nr:putative manganese efflux pump MntP [Clostridium sp. CAG:245]
MGAIEILLISIGLAMDAFAVSVCKGLAMKKMSWKKAIIIGLYFGIFQAVMPVIGYFLGTTFERFITNVDHWIAFILLVGIGINMVKEAFDKESENRNDNVDVKTMLVLSIATSIDALAIGITFACLKIHIVMPVITIGLITFIISVIGVKIGNRFGDKYGKKAGIMGGVILILLGIKILLEHLGIINF